jgi:hypothetical protein
MDVFIYTVKFAVEGVIAFGIIGLFCIPAGLLLNEWSR